jgi:predicted phosphodiesterase
VRINHPQAQELFRELEQGRPLEHVASEATPPVPASTLRRWWKAHKADNVELLGSAVDVEPEAIVAELTSERQRRENAERRTRLLEAQIADLSATNRDLSEVAGFILEADNRDRAVPEWFAPKSGVSHHATVNLVLSDLHLDEVVRPAEVGGVNAYNRVIAEKRLQRTFVKACELPRDYLASLTYDGIVVHLAGDTFSGDIHEELMRTNEATPLESLLYWLDPMVAGLRLLAEEYGKVHVVSVPGNHDRSSRKPVHKGRVVTSFHYVFSRMLEREFRGDERVTWDIPQSPDALTEIYSTRLLTTHGDRFKGGSGIGGILIPILRGDAKTRQRQQAIGQPYDLLVMGHFHQYVQGPGVLINGSAKGYDEYAYNMGFGYEPPQQALFLVTPEQGANFHMPIRCMDRKSEGW